MGRAIASDGDPKGVQGGERKATLLASMGDNFAVNKSPWWGLQSVEKPQVGRLCPQTALRWFAGNVLQHKA